MALQLAIRNLSVTYQKTCVLSVPEFTIFPGECVGLIGESGSGKSTLALSIMRLLENAADIKGEIRYGKQNLLSLSQAELSGVRWRQIAIVFQNSLEVWNPVLTIGEQITECIIKHLQKTPASARKDAGTCLQMAGLDNRWAAAYPHQLSGGMRQKALVAMAIACHPDVLIVDEPTMALDAGAKQEIVTLLKKLQEEHRFSMLVISHELPVIMALARRTLVMYGGSFMEEGDISALLDTPNHPYTRGLVYASPAVNPYRDMWGIPGEMQNHGRGCPFINRCVQAVPQCRSSRPELTASGSGRRTACHLGGIVTLLRSEHIHKTFTIGKTSFTACNDCSLEIKSGEIAALIGESGSGKTTLGSILAGIIPSDSGTVFFDHRRLSGNSETSRPGGIQMVFQDPFSAMNEHLTVEEIVREPLDIIKAGSLTERKTAVIQALKEVQLPSEPDFLLRRGHTLSGGQRQRAALARALTMTPRLLIADELTSMLDPSTGANIMRLLKGLQNSLGFSVLFITHDLALAQKLSDVIYVMQEGKIVEKGSSKAVFQTPEHDYTRHLVAHARASEMLISV